VQPDSRDRSPERYSPGVRFLFRAGLLLGCPCPRTPNRSRGPSRVSPGSPLLGFFLPRAFLRRVPRSPRPVAAIGNRPSSRAEEGEGRQAFTGAVLRVLAPLDGSGCVRGSRGPLAGPAVRRDAPTLRGLVPCRSRPLESPFRAFPSRGAVPALAGLLLPCGFALDRPTARHGPWVSRHLSPARRPLRHGEHEARRTGRPGRRFPGVARRRSFACCHARVRRLSSDRPGSPDSAAGTPASKLCSPRESVPVTVAALARVRPAGRCSPGFRPL